jgi:hypothetical protein
MNSYNILGNDLLVEKLNLRTSEIKNICPYTRIFNQAMFI